MIYGFTLRGKIKNKNMKFVKLTLFLMCRSLVLTSRGERGGGVHPPGFPYPGHVAETSQGTDIYVRRTMSVFKLVNGEKVPKTYQGATLPSFKVHNSGQLIQQRPEL